MVCANEKCKSVFTAYKAGQKFCSVRCRKNVVMRRWRTKYLDRFNAARRAKMIGISREALEKRRKARRESAKRLRKGISRYYQGGICRANNDVCAEAARGIQHRHCDCGMPMTVSAKFCEWCLRGK